MKKPNILIFLPDAMQAQVVTPDHDCKTPNFDRLAQRGVRFTRAHCPLPTCSPSRASLMTGLLPHNHGVLQVEYCVDDDQSVLRTEHPHWAQRLSDAGYRTGYFGKWHIERSNRLEEFGWQVNGCNEAASFRKLGAGVGSREALLRDSPLVRMERGPEGYNDILHYAVSNVPSAQRNFSTVTGELVADYALRFKQSYGWDDVWVAGYNNEFLSYVPSKRVLLEGGYEGTDGMMECGHPAPFTADVEEIIATKVDELLRQCRRQ